MEMITYNKEVKGSKMISFDERFAEIHAEIQKDIDLVETLFELEQKNRWEVVESGEDKRIYFPIDKVVNNIYLGVDLYKWHTIKFPEIMANMRLIYEASEGNADIPKVYTPLAPSEECKWYDCIGIVSEDFSKGNQLIVKEECTEFDNPFFDLLTSVFMGCDNDDICHSTFTVGKQIKPTSTEIQVLRTPIADLDHIGHRATKYEKNTQTTSDNTDQIEDLEYIKDDKSMPQIYQ